MFSCYYYCGRGVHLHTVTRDQQPQDINMFQSSWRLYTTTRVMQVSVSFVAHLDSD